MPIQIPRPSASHSLSARLGGWLRNLVQWAASPRGRRAGGITASVIVLFGISAWFGVPPLVRSIATHQASAWLERPVTLGQVRFNPFTLRLDVEQLHVGDRGGDQRFVDIDGLTVNLSWSSLFRLAAIVDSITVTHPQIRIDDYDCLMDRELKDMAAALEIRLIDFRPLRDLQRRSA